MIVSLRLQQFRSYIDESFEFSPGVNIIVGPNASGKTNLLEALLVLTRGASYRAKDSELMQYGSAWTRLDAQTTSVLRTLKVETTTGTGAPLKIFEIAGKPYRRLTTQTSVPVVVFEPNHLLLLTGSPELRRNFLDDFLTQTLPGFAALNRQYRRTLAQRNALLRKAHTQANSQLFAWNVRLSELGGQIAQARQGLMSELNKGVGALYSALSGAKVSAELFYQSTCQGESYASALLHKLETSIAVDYERGFTAHGPHRDDMLVMLDGHNAKDIASRGETRTLVLVLKILEMQLLEAARGQQPLLLLDDVFSELDGARRRALTHFLKPYQTFITTTDADVVVEHFTKSATVIPLNRP